MTGGAWIEDYGYLAVLVGAILEGETVCIAAGYAISQEYLRPIPTFLAAVVGGSVGDLTYFTLGRLYGATLLRRFVFLRRLRARAVVILRRWGRATAALTRFAFGLRVVLPITIGMVRFPFIVFALFNLLGSLAFAGLYLSLGYLSGETLEEVLGTVRSIEKPLLVALVLVGMAVWAAREWRLYAAGSADDEIPTPSHDPGKP